MVRVSSPAKLRPWSELIAKMVRGVVPGLVRLEVKVNFDPKGGQEQIERATSIKECPNCKVRKGRLWNSLSVCSTVSGC